MQQIVPENTAQDYNQYLGKFRDHMTFDLKNIFKNVLKFMF